MILFRRNVLLLFVLISVPLTFNGMNTPNDDDNIFDLVKAEHANAIDTRNQKKYVELSYIDKDGKLIEHPWEVMARGELERQILQPPFVYFGAACDALKKSKYFPDTYQHLQMDGATREDLKILRGSQRGKDSKNKSDEEKKADEAALFDCLVNKVNKTDTLGGRAVLCAYLTRPQVSFEQLASKQVKIETLIQLHKNPQFALIEQHLKQASEGENAFLSFFIPGDGFAFEMQNKKVELPLANKIPIIKKIQDWANKSPLYLTLQEAKPALFTAVSVGLGALTRKKTFLDLWKIVSGPNVLNPSAYLDFVNSIGFEATKDENNKLNYVLKLVFPDKFVNFLGIGLAAQGGLQEVNAPFSVKKTMANSLITIKYMRKKLHIVSKTMRSFKDAQVTLLALSRNNGGKMLVDLKLPESTEAKETLEMLSTPTFSEDHDRLWLVYWGRVKSAYVRLCETAHQFKPTYAALAELDFLMGSAHLIIDNPAPLIRDSTQKAKYCLPTFTRNAQTPALQATNGWNPFINKDQKVVLNNVQLGQDGKKMLIITGPNRQGKTVYMNMILYAALMSQALGVAPAQEFSMTPYNDLITFMKTETDTSKGESLFVNICKRGKICFNILRNGRGFKLFGTDEPFNGTKHLLAESTVDEFLKPIGAHPNVNGMITTHLKAATRLPASYPVHFMNLKVKDHHVEPGIGYCETEAEGLKIIEEELGSEFAEAVKNNMKSQTIHEYWEQQERLDDLVIAARREYQALRQQAGTPTVDGIIANITDPQLRAELDQEINNPSIGKIHALIHRLRNPQFDRFFDLVGHVAIVGQLSSEAHQQTFKDLMLSIMAHCADATATAHSAPWLERIAQIDANIAQEHERRAKLQQEINALHYVRSNESLSDQLHTEKRSLTAIAKRADEKIEEIDDVQRELGLRQNLRRLQVALSQQNVELDSAITEARRLIQSLQLQSNPQQNN